MKKMNESHFLYCILYGTRIIHMGTHIHMSHYNSICVSHVLLVPGTVHTVHNFCISYIPRGIINFTAVHSTDDIELFYYFGKKI
jgi:hypothetical protein